MQKKGIVIQYNVWYLILAALVAAPLAAYNNFAMGILLLSAFLVWVGYAASNRIGGSAFVWEWTAVCMAYLKALAVCSVLQRVSFAPVARLAFIARFVSWIVVLVAFVAITIETRKRD